MIHHYAVIGNPVKHSLSPYIHQKFAKLCSKDLTYELLHAPLDAFAPSVRDFMANGGNGLNVTIPFKQQAFMLADTNSPAAKIAGAVNTLTFRNQEIYGDNTDGAGLVHDITHNLNFPIARQHILLIGAGGAARGSLLPLLQQLPASLTIVNRTRQKAHDLAKIAQTHTQIPIQSVNFNHLSNQKFDIIINASSSSLENKIPPLSEEILTPDTLLYDMMYANELTSFLSWGKTADCHHLADGLGMLVEQAAEAFYIWHGIRPQTQEVLNELRQR